jgi:hypothetical protein
MRMRWLALMLVVAAGPGMAACGDDDETPASAAPTATPAGPITVEQLVERSADTPIAVEGFLHASDGDVRLCAAILESYPPQCGEPSVELVGLDMEALDGVTTAEGVSWKEGVVLTVQRRQDARFDVLAG